MFLVKAEVEFETELLPRAWTQKGVVKELYWC